MGKDIMAAFRPALSFLLLMTVITGLIYPLAVLALGQALFPYQANGSLIEDGGRIVGSELIGQRFESAGYFHARPSAAGDGYDAAASSGSNLGPASAKLAADIAARVAAARADGAHGAVPAHAATASASGLDPHISPAMALIQVPRIAAARKLAPETLRRLVADAVERPTFGLLGEPRINTLLINRQLDRLGANSPR